MTRYHLGLDAEKEGKMCAPYAMSMILVGHTCPRFGYSEMWKHVATHAIDNLAKENGWTVLKVNEIK